MGWTYEEYMSQPAWFIEKIKMMKELDGEHKELQDKHSK